MRHRHFFLQSLLAFSLSVSLPRISPAQESSGQKAAATAEVFADLAKPGSPGCAVGIARDSKVIFSGAYGMANLEQNLPLTPDSVFDIASVSKQFSATSILLLEKDGKLSLHDDIRKYLPELPEYGKTITILHLLNHTSGLRDYLTLFDLAGINTDSVTTSDDALAYLSRQKALNFDPGSRHLYSNSGYFLLSLIVQRVSGQSLRDFAAENIFQPLAMTHTQFRDSHTLLIPDRALAYDPLENGTRFALALSYFEQNGDGGVHTTVGDLLKWQENFDTATVGGPALLANLQQPGVLNSGKTLDYAKGLRIANYRGLPTIGHTGSWSGYRAALLRFPAQRFSVVCLCNRSDANPSLRIKRIADIYLASLMKEKKPDADDADSKPRPAIPIPAQELLPFAGDFWSEELGVAYRFQVLSNTLTLNAILGSGSIPRSSDLEGKPLVPVGKDEFELPAATLVFRFQRDSTGAPVSFILDSEDASGMIFRRQ